MIRLARGPLGARLAVTGKATGYPTVHIMQLDYSTPTYRCRKEVRRTRRIEMPHSRLTVRKA